MVSSGLSFRRAPRSGPYHRVAEIAWENPMDGAPGKATGGRWNSPGSFPVVYLNRTVKLARLYVAQKLRDQPYGPEDIDPETGDVLATVNLSPHDYVDVISDQGCLAVGLPVSYPIDESGRLTPHKVCQPIGDEAWQANERGIACRSATAGAAADDEELAWFQRDHTLTAERVLSFTNWFFGLDAP